MPERSSNYSVRTGTCARPLKTKQRLDLLLVERGFFPSREKAQRAIMAGAVRVGDHTIDKPGARVAADETVTVKAADRYVSRGGLKLEHALDFFGIDPAGATCLDVGASTGGFTDCLLQRGAARVYAIDVGHSQLDWKIRSDPRVLVQEKVNARHLGKADIPEPVSICVVDVSFISLTLILPPLFQLLTPSGVIVALIKPQFELGRADVGKGGIVKDPALHERAIGKIRDFISSAGKSWVGVTPSPILGTEGNREFLACIRP
jgi:23S rRNA (cytidine1920-2'-O)/16S rRNA (cytidine1409-2'-O)-methyltransferase